MEGWMVCGQSSGEEEMTTPDFYERLAGVFADIAAGRQVAHEDHPLRHWDRTCPGCLWEEAFCSTPAPQPSLAPEQEEVVFSSDPDLKVDWKPEDIERLDGAISDVLSKAPAAEPLLAPSAEVRSVEGWVMVPVEPTPDMLIAGGGTPKMQVISGVVTTHQLRTGENLTELAAGGTSAIYDTYKAILSAAPALPPAREKVGEDAKDAARYRWLRSNQQAMVKVCDGEHWATVRGEDLDINVDILMDADQVDAAARLATASQGEGK
jgi:hypothetical protein